MVPSYNTIYKNTNNKPAFDEKLFTTMSFQDNYFYTHLYALALNNNKILNRFLFNRW